MMIAITKLFGGGLLAASLFLPAFNVAALECHKDTTSGPVADYENIGAMKIPSTLPIGSRLWTSKTYSRNLACWAYKNKKPNGEYSFFYPNPYGAVIGTGIGIGIIYNGQDLGVVTGGGTSSSRVSTGMFVYPGPSGSLPPSNPTMLPVTVQVYLEKIGDMSNASYGVDSLSVFQVDGELGINKNPGGNYQFTLSGLKNIDVIQCSAQVHVSPDNNIDFGTIQSWSDASAGLLAKQGFQISASTDGGEDCGLGFNLTINFDTATKGNAPVGIDGMDMGNGSTLKINEESSGNGIPFNEFVTFINNLTSASGTVEKRYSASLYASGPAVTGDVEKYIVLRFNYN
ncbi:MULTISPECIES: hypothetical protein [unclassified Brenneria]|uniref:hypothetical protein n=1 Tax=unclassified Brenneria TaxID=2634434 RepID=UPI0029C3BD74|nr:MULTISPECIES: hypothetical protein [unclassified Brenneria]MDX5627897.1 hypothetical protein [Brenneria sp. L3-3Z]MDX5694735.1 hypothetical protein [Brenneria sp. L4-2C]